MSQPVTMVFPEGTVQLPAYLTLHRDDTIDDVQKAIVATTRSTESIVGQAATVSGMRGKTYPYKFEVTEDSDSNNVELRITVTDSTNPLEITTASGRTEEITNDIITIYEDADAQIGTFRFEILLPN